VPTVPHRHVAGPRRHTGRPQQQRVDKQTQASKQASKQAGISPFNFKLFFWNSSQIDVCVVRVLSRSRHRALMLPYREKKKKDSESKPDLEHTVVMARIWNIL
jgi:hypothetical protein